MSENLPRKIVPPWVRKDGESQEEFEKRIAAQWETDRLRREMQGPSANDPNALKGLFSSSNSDARRERFEAEKMTRERAQQMSERELVLSPLDQVEMRAIPWIWLGWLPQGYITIVAGESGTGKSTLIADVVARVTTGAAWPFEGSNGVPRPPANVIWLTSEDGAEDMIKPRLVAAGADVRRVCQILGVQQGRHRKAFSLQDDIAQVSALLKRMKAAASPVVLLVIDPVTSYVSGTSRRGVDINNAGDMRSVLEPWMALAHEFQLTILCVTHLRKDQNGAAVHRVLGSGAFVATSRSVWLLTADPEGGADERILTQAKSNLPDRPVGSIRLVTEVVVVGSDPNSGLPIKATRVAWKRVDPEYSLDTTPKKPGPESTFSFAFGLWLQAYFNSTGGGERAVLPVTQVKNAALGEKVVSRRWWDDHSSEFLEKENRNGEWYCWRKGSARTTV